MKKKYTYWVILGLIIASLAAFGRIAGNDFINFDDHGYITENIHIQSGVHYQSIKWAFTNIVENNWVPLSMISHMLDWSLFGAHPAGHHIVSLLLHIGAVIFLFLFLYKTTNHLWSSAFAAAFFALHPLRVESVAWASERKDVLSLFFGMASLYAYAFYVRDSRFSKYFICLILFALSLLSKSMLVTLPFVFLLMDYWPLGRWQGETRPLQRLGKLMAEKIPFFILTIASSIVTVWAQYGDGSPYMPLVTRVYNAMITYVAYMGMTLWPLDLVVFYPFVESFPLWKILTSGLILIGVTILVIKYFTKTPFLFAGWFWFLGTLIPVIGLVPVNQPMADHYTYLPSIGIAIMFSWGIPCVIKSEIVRKKILFPAAIMVILISVILTWNQCGYWKNSITIFQHALQVTENNYLAHNNIALVLTDEGKYREAMEHYEQAIRIFPEYAFAYNNRGSLYITLGLNEQALNDFNQAIALREDRYEAYNNRGLVFANTGQYEQAIHDYIRATNLKPDHPHAYHKKGIIHFKQGDHGKGCFDARKACERGECKLLQWAAKGGYCR
jgi:tetratricopeptide (TPR) repeat protein